MGPPSQTLEFTVMWQQYAPRVMAYALRHVAAGEAEEVVAETFLVAWRRFSDVPAQPLPWLLVVARNTIANLRRSAQRQVALQVRISRLDQLAEPVPAAEVSVLQRAEVLAALAVLSDAEREALLLVAWDGLSSAQAARVAGCTAATLHVRLFRARRRLRAYRDTETGLVSSTSVRESVRTAHE